MTREKRIKTLTSSRKMGQTIQQYNNDNVRMVQHIWFDRELMFTLTKAAQLTEDALW